MSAAIDALPPGHLVENIVHFTRALRKAGVKVGTAQVENAIRAVETAGFSQRVDFYHILRATLITRAEDLEVFHQIFSMFWGEPEFLENMMHMLSPTVRDDSPPPPPASAQKRAEQALADNKPKEKDEENVREEIVDDALYTVSQVEVLKQMDFEQMSAEELAEAERAIRALTLPVPQLISRRTHPDRRGRLPDAHATLRRSLRRGGEFDRIERKRPWTRPPDLVAVCDISGSMSVYSRMLMRYLHALNHAPVRSWGRVHAFTFGTRLTNVSRALDQKDPDAALNAVGREATDWEGGTRIGPAIERFNKDWSRRVLSRGAVVLLITDGLERGDTTLLATEIERLSLSCRHLIWLNPLLRFDGFAPLAGGIRAMLPHVSSFHACHSLESLGNLTDALGQSDLRDRLLRQL